MNQSAKNYLAPRTRFSQHKLALAIAAQIYALSVYAGPTGGEVVGGAGSIEQQGAETIIVQNTDRLAIDWQSFDVGKNERVEFVQPGQSAVALNRILGNRGSEILGRIDANGHVILVNPRGVVFGEGAIVNAGGLIASGLQINPDDFMNGDLVFKRIEGTDGTVINSGMINAASGGNVVLLGAQAENRGLISARLGSVILASGKEAVLTFDESGLLGVRVDQAVLQGELGDVAAVQNSGEIRAESGRVLLSASTTRDVFSQAVNWGDQKQARSVTYNEDGSFTLGAGGNVVNSGNIIASGENSAGDIVVLGESITNTGIIRADAAKGSGGDIELHSNTTTTISAEGLVSANGNIGGDIKLLGKNVGLFDKSVVEAVGTVDGGTVLVGGDREGLNAWVRNADFVYIGEETKVDVSATDFGNGGTLIIYADDTARIYGNLSATGGQLSGNGGFVETSGKHGFEIDGVPDVSAPEGSAGHWLIDPYNIQISNNPSNPQVTGSSPFESLGTGANLSVDDLLPALNAGATVTVKTGESDGPGEDGNITIATNTNILFEQSNTTATLNLIAHNNIVFNNNTSITASKSSNSVLNIHLNANTSNNQGSITFGNNTRIETGSGDFKIGHINDDGSINTNRPGAYDINLNGLTLDTDTGDFFAHAANRLTLGQDLNTRGGDLLLGATEWNFNNRRLNTTTDNSSNVSGNITLITAGDLTLPEIRAAGDVTIRNRDVSSEVTVSNPNNEDRRVQLAGMLIFDLGVGSASLTNVRTASQNTQDTAFATNIEVVSGGNISLEVDNSIRLNNVKMTGDLRLDSESEIVQLQNTSVEIGGVSTLLVDDHDVTLDGAANKFDGALYIGGSNDGAARNATIVSAGSVVFGEADQTITLTGNLSVDAGADIRQNGALNIAGTAELAADNVIDLQNPNNEFSSLSISRAQTATVDYTDNLQLAEVRNIGQFNLAVQGNLTQTAALDVNQLVLDISGSTSLTQSENRIGTLSGTNLSGGNISVAGLLQISDLTITAGTTINAAEIDLAGPVQLTGEADLIFNGVSNFTLNGELQGADEVVNSVTVNGDDSHGTYTISDTARWNAVAFAISGGDGTDKLQGPNLGATWSLTEMDEHTLSTLEQGELTFSDMETLSGGNQVDTFAFVDATTTELSLLGGDGDDVADYSGISGNVSVSLSDIARLQEIELVRGNNNGESSDNNSALIAEGDGEHTWTISAVNSGTVASDDDVTIAFEHFNQLQGGAGADHFILQADLQGGGAQIDGGAGDDIFDVEVDFTADLIGGAGNDRFNLAAATFGSLLGGGGNDTFVLTADSRVVNLDGGGDQNTILGFDADLIWEINEGAVVSVAGDNIYVENAVRITGLEGADGDDTFLFWIADSGVGVDGGEGVNKADFSTVAGNLTVNLGNLDQLGVSNVAEIAGNNSGLLGLYNSALVATGTGGADWHLSGTNAGTYNPADGEAITFSGFNQLFGGSGDDNFHLAANVAGVDAIVSGGDGNNRYTFSTDFSADVTGGEDRDQFIVEEGARLAGTLDGRGGENVLALYDANLTWTIDRTNDESPRRVRVSEELELLPGEILPPLPVSVSVVTQALNLTSLQGGAGDDTFVYNISDSGVSADGGGGFNTADFSGIEGELEVGLGADAVFGVTRVNRLIGNGSDSTLRGADQASEWLLGADGEGQVTWDDQVTLFSGFGHWAGGTDADIFTLHTLSGAPTSIQGGGGSDTLDLSTAGIGVDLGLGLDVGGDLNLAEIESVRANSNFSNSLTSGANQVTWTIDGVNSGFLTDDQGFTVHFENFQNLEGLHSNTFRIEDGGELVGGSVTGGTEGENRLAASGSYDQLWSIDGTGQGTLERGESFFLVFNNLTALVGGGGDDDFVITDAGAAIGSIDGGGGNNTLRANFTRNNTLEWLVDDTSRRITGMVDSFQRISRLYGQSGADRFTVNGEVNLELINSGAGDDDIRLFGSSHIDRILAGEGSDTIAISNQATVGNSQTPDERPIDGGEGSDTLDLTNYSRAVIWNSVDRRVTVSDSNVIFEYLSIENFKAPNGEGLKNTFQAPDGKNTWTITARDTGSLETEDGETVTYEAIANLLGGGLEDLFIFLPDGSVTGKLDGGAGNNTIQGSDSGYQWTIDGTDAGRMANASEQIAAFENVQTLIGGAGADQFEIAAGGRLTGGFDAGAGNDTLTSRRDRQIWQITGDDSGIIEDGEVELLSFTGIDAITGSNTDTLRGDDSDRLWLLSGAGTGSIGSMTFSGFRDLIGGAGADSFVVTQDGAINGVIDGGGGSNDLLVQKSGAVSVNLDPERQMENAFNVRRLQTIEVENSVINNLYGAGGDDAEYLWIVDGTNTGFVGEGTESGVNFANFANLFGGSGSDNFQITTSGKVAGIDGGGGADYLDYSEYVGNLTVTIGGNLGQDANFTITSVEGVRGNDNGLGSRWTATLQARDGTNTWTLTADGEPGRDGINDGVVQSNGDSIVFRDFSYLQGGSGNDTFVFEGQGMLTGSIRDNGGSNRLDLAKTDRSMRVIIFTTENLPFNRPDNGLFIQGLQTVKGKGVSTTLVGPGVSANWMITNQNAGEVSYLDRKVTFTDFGNVSGGGSTDTFTVSTSGSMSGWFSGGNGTAEDIINFTGESPVSVWWGSAAPEEGWHWLNGGFDVVRAQPNQAQPNPQNRLVSVSDAAQEWEITGSNSGTVAKAGNEAALSFEGFAHLLGGGGDDYFVFSSTGSLSGLLDGGAGNNEVNLEEIGAPLSVSIGNRVDANLQVARIQQIIANENGNNWLWGSDQDTQWNIDGPNSGYINTGTVVFSGFANLRGGAGDDQFIFSNLGELTGQIDGGAHNSEDVADYRSILTDLTIDLSGTTRLVNIEQLIGSDKITLQGPNRIAHWQILDGNGRGLLTYSDQGAEQRLSFSDINQLIGGDLSDEFSIAGGAVVVGGIRGGAGADRFVVSVGGSGSLSLIGDADNDSLEFEGGGSGWTGVYSQKPDGSPQFAFSAPNSNTISLTVGYGGVESVSVRSSLDRMTLTGRREEEDEFRLGAQSWQVGDLESVSYSNMMRGLEVKGGSEDTIFLSGEIKLANELILSGAATNNNSALLETEKLVLSELQGAGTSQNPLDISVEELTLTNNTGEIYLREANGVQLNGLTGENTVELQLLRGDLTQSEETGSRAINSSGDLRFTARLGEIQLNRADNQITNTVALEAGTEATLHANGDLVLAEVNAQDLQLEVSGDISSNAALQVSNIARFTSGGDINLNVEGNTLNQVVINAVGNANLSDSGTLMVMDSNVGGDLQLAANRIELIGTITSNLLNAAAGPGGFAISGNVTVDGDALFDSSGEPVNNSYVFAMAPTGHIRSTAGNIEVTTDGSQSLSKLTAENGDVFLSSGNGIIDSNDTGGSVINITAKAFRARAETGIGAGNPLELAVGLVDVLNTSGDVSIANFAPLTVERLRNGGNITLTNSTDVTFMTESVNAYAGTETPEYPANKEDRNAGYNFSLSLTGNIKTDGIQVIQQPHISARSVTITNPFGVFLPPSPVIYAPAELTIRIGRSRNRPPWGWNVRPRDINDDTQYYGDVVGAGEQLIDVESLAEIDPAIFTQVKNYFYQDVSIRLPSDQLYEEEEEL